MYNLIRYNTAEKLEEAKKKNYEATQKIASILQDHKGFITAYGNPGLGRIIINYNGQNFRLDIEPIETNAEDKSIESAVREYRYIFDN